MRTVWSTPTSRAIFKGWSSRSVVQTSSAPAVFAAPAARIPIGPDPLTRTFAPATPPALFRACNPTANGSASTARESGRDVRQHPDLVLADNACTRRIRPGCAGSWPPNRNSARCGRHCVVRRHIPGSARTADAGMDRDRGVVGSVPEGSSLDASDDLVAEDQRFTQGEGTDGAVPVVVQIRTADAAMGVAHQHLSRFGRARAGRRIADRQPREPREPS